MAADPPALEAVAPQLLMDAESISAALRRMAVEIADQKDANASNERMVLIGVQTRGVEVAKRLAACIHELRGVDLAFGAVDISMHRDDLFYRPRLQPIQITELPLDLDDCAVVLVDDVFATGRTARAAMDAMNAFGRARRVQLAVLIDREQRQLPIRPDFTGKSVPTDPADRIRVRLRPIDDQPDAVWLIKGQSPV